jgi:hypothetical protein
LSWRASAEPSRKVLGPAGCLAADARPAPCQNRARENALKGLVFSRIDALSRNPTLYEAAALAINEFRRCVVSLVSEVAAALYREEKPIRMPVMSGARNVPRLGLCSSPSNVNERACIVPRRIAVCPPTGQLLDDSLPRLHRRRLLQRIAIPRPHDAIRDVQLDTGWKVRAGRVDINQLGRKVRIDGARGCPKSYHGRARHFRIAFEQRYPTWWELWKTLYGSSKVIWSDTPSAIRYDVSVRSLPGKNRPVRR